MKLRDEGLSWAEYHLKVGERDWVVTKMPAGAAREIADRAKERRVEDGMVVCDGDRRFPVELFELDEGEEWERVPPKPQRGRPKAAPKAAE